MPFYKNPGFWLTSGAVLVIVLLFLLFFGCQPKPIPTPTETAAATMTPWPLPSLTPSPTLAKPTLTVAPTKPVSTLTATSTVPVATEEPVYVLVNTGYNPGWLHFRRAPLLGSNAMWPDHGALQEGTKLYFLECAYTPYPWMLVTDTVQDGWVYAPFVSPNLCKGAE